MDDLQEAQRHSHHLFFRLFVTLDFSSIPDENEELYFVCLTVQTTVVLCSAFGVTLLTAGISIAFFILKHRRNSQRYVENLLSKS